MTDILDPATSGTTRDEVWSERLQLWLPIIQGGAPDEDADSTDDGDGTSTDDDEDATSGDKDDSDKDQEKTFSQKEVNALIARETAKAGRGKLDPKELGFDSGKELKEFLDSMKDKEEAAKSEAEKAQEEAIQTAIKEAESKVLSKANARLVRAEFKLKAASSGVEHESDAFALAQHTELWENVEVSDDGEVTGFDDAFFAALKESKPFLFKEDEDTSNSGGGDANAGAAGNKGRKTRADTLAELYPEVKQAQDWAALESTK